MPAHSTNPVKRFNRIGSVAVAAFAAASLAACSSSAPSEDGVELTPLTVRTSFNFGPSSEAMFLAIDNGYFEEAGLDVDFKEGSGSTAVMQLMGESEDTDIGVTIDSGTAAMNISQGVPVKIAQINKKIAPFGTTCYESAGVAGPEDLSGKSVLVVPSESTAAIFPAYLALFGLTEDDVNVVNADAATKTSLFLTGRADCMIGYTSSDVLQAYLAGEGLTEPVSWNEGGLKLLGDAVVVRNTLLEENPEVVSAFVSAMNRGYAAMCADQDAAIEGYNNRFDGFTDSDRAYTEQAIPIECAELKPTEDEAFGGVTDEEWSAALDTLAKYNGLDPVLPVEDYFTSDLGIVRSDW